MEGFKSHAVFKEIEKVLQEVGNKTRLRFFRVGFYVFYYIVRVVSTQEGEAYVKKIGGVFTFKVRDGPDGKEALWVVDVKNGKGLVNNDAGVSVVSFVSFCFLFCFS